MAYSYQQNMFSGASEGYVKYNISPAFSLNMGIGDTFTITGQVYSRDGAVKSIACAIGTALDNYGFLENGVDVSVVNKSVAKGKTGTFSITCTIPQALVNLGAPDANGLFKGYLSFTVWDGANGTGSGSGTKSAAAQAYNIIKVRAAPTVSSLSLTDRHAAISNGQTPLAYFGGYVQGVSVPRISIAFATDSRDAKLTATHVLQLSGGTLAAAITLTQSTGTGVTSVIFDLAEPDFSGTISYVYTVTDSMGLTATTSGSVVVYPYSSPSLTGFSATRYKTELSEHGTIDRPADDGSNVWITLAGEVSAIAGKNAWSLVLIYGALDEVSRTTVNVASDTDGDTIAYVEDKTILAATLTAAATYELVAVLTDMLGSTQAITLALKAGGFLDIEKNGVAVGMRTTATSNDKKFEVAEDYVAHFYGGVEGVTNFVAAETPTGGHWIDGKPIYRSILTISATAVQTWYHSAGGGIADVDAVVRFDMIASCGNGSPVFNGPFNYNSDMWQRAYLQKNATTGNLEGIYYAYSSNYLGAVHYIVYYTKTTD